MPKERLCLAWLPYMGIKNLVTKEHSQGQMQEEKKKSFAIL